MLSIRGPYPPPSHHNHHHCRLLFRCLRFDALCFPKQFNSFEQKGNEDLCDKLDTSTLNAHLKELMPGLTAKVFRTYNASITLDDMLNRDTKGGGNIAENIFVYNQPNKEVAIICNYQRSVSKSHNAEMMKLNEKIQELKGVVQELVTNNYSNILGFRILIRRAFLQAC
ncbi:hypothetical protein L2E82_31298 [Cichorium intybus]|uniref:Uncharacterized protein n=1 Tax=Cichorium intybus TaxID=13427 RepID=A0ACB9D2M2_CICIN|nr:hypothetical protein L2E82_31298 [Cichorium intybus]